MGFIKTAYRAMQTRFASFMWAHADPAFVERCIQTCVDVLDTDRMSEDISERIIDAVDLEEIKREVEHSLVENTDVDTSDVAEAIADHMDTREIASDVCSQVQEYISVSQISDEIVETVGEEVKDDCIERIMEEIEAQRDGWAEVLAQRLVKNDEFVTALAVALLRTNKEASDATA